MTHELIPGQHIKVNRLLYGHHGIFMGWDPYTRRPIVAELSKPSSGGKVQLVWLDEFRSDGQIEVVHHADGLPGDQVVRNVHAMMGRGGYQLLDWNCEHFATWCSTHEVESAQVTQVKGIAAALLVVFGLALIVKAST